MGHKEVVLQVSSLWMLVIMMSFYMFRPGSKSLSLELELDSVSSWTSWRWEVVGHAVLDLSGVRDVFLAGCGWVSASLVLFVGVFFSFGL